MFTRRTTARSGVPALLAALAALSLAATGCSSDGGSADGKGRGPAVIAPGKPGEPARTLSAEEAAESGEDDTPNSADFRYIRMMITHHRQALVMAALAPDRAESGRVKKLAERISTGQRPEIEAMKGWLVEYAENDPGQGHSAHDHEAMPGMATEKQLEQLRAAHGAAFDTLFLKLMIRHHTGAVTMATELLTSGNNVRVEEMANEVVSQQSAEIERMRRLG
ncbi:DUF305 domain-containing protein [Streptomyces palmae]|uniref:DUF305 domain-containing protein n=1 Tax=Streptomyces palmae TaxID=1701085 RepID=UPI001FD7B6BC|nr:DUF305 domain-containing protein [Streptomyces palmae]